MKYGLPTCQDPSDPSCIYMRCMYYEFFWGPFKDEEEITKAINKLDADVPYWDYDCFCIVYGKNPLPEDYVFGFESIPEEMRSRIEKQRKTAPQNNAETASTAYNSGSMQYR